MPVHPNPKREAFVQELHKGKTLSDAHRAAGFNGDRRNASKLRQEPDIVRRYDQVALELSEAGQKATAEAAERLSLSREWVLEQLRSNALKAAENEDFGPSNRALELIGKEIAGMFVDRKHVDIDGELRGYTDAQLIALFAGDEGEEGVGEEGSAALPH